MTDGKISPVPREARPYQGETAGLVTRLIANTVDALVVGGVLLAGFLGWNAFQFLLNPRSFHFSGSSAVLSLVAGAFVAVVYMTAAWAVTGRTYGDHVMGLRVVNRRGGRLRPVGALVRAVCYVVFPIGVLWCGWSRSRRSLQDTFLRTRVVYDWSPHRANDPDGLAPEAPA